MTLDEMVSLIEARAALVSPQLDEGLALALTQTEQRVGDLIREGHLHLRPLTVRALLRRHLESTELRGWRLGGDPRLMGQLLIDDTEGGLSMRVLKERRHTYPGGVPVAGHNRTRRAYWAQPPLFGTDAPPDVDYLKLLMLWDLKDPQRVDEGYTLRLVHTLEPGRYGIPVACDLSIDIQTGGSLFSTLRFRGDDEPHDFFEIQIDEAEDQPGS